jgi:ABC-2 type transport system permease protein
MYQDIKELYQYREMLKNLVRKDLRTRYKGSFLGFLWTFINPLLQLIVYSVVFSTIMRFNIEKYPMFLFVAIIPWIFFANSVQVSAGNIIANKELVKKIYFPREILPIAVVSAGLINLIYGLIIVFLSLVIFNIHLTTSILYLPLVILLEYIFTLSLSLLVSALNVYFRDIEHILSIIMMSWFYLTPIIFPVEMIPQEYQGYFLINPMTTIITAYRDILYYAKVPDFLLLSYFAGISVILLIISYKFFKVLQKKFAEEV